MRRWLSAVLATLIPLVFVSAFLGMAWVRSRQEIHEQDYPSDIEALAIHKAPADPLEDARNRGREVYTHYCQICHGEKGKGDGFNASRLDPPPRDFSDAKFWRESTDERLFDVVAHGGPYVGKSVLMPAWGHTLKPRQIRDTIVFIRALGSQQQPAKK